jgi:hypothetical protein
MPTRRLPATSLVLVLLLLVALVGRAGATPVVMAPVVMADTGVTLPEPQPDAGDVHRRADDILAGPAYQEPPGSLVDRVLRWILEHLGRLLSGVSGGAGGGSTVVVWILLVVLIGVAVFLVSRWQIHGRRRRPQHDPLAITEAEAARTVDGWLAEAVRLEGQGRWKLGLRCRYRALVGTLFEQGVVGDLPGRTSGEFRIEVRRRAPAKAAAFAAASDLFDAAWYGDRPTGPDEQARFRRLADEVVAAGRDARAPGSGGDLVASGGASS